MMDVSSCDFYATPKEVSECVASRFLKALVPNGE